jgi:hypothetical protein
MHYNSQKSQLVMSEYGRNVHQLVDLAILEQDTEKRSRMVKGIIELMGQLNPHLRNIEDYRHKLWDHLFLISDFKLEVESPYPLPQKEVLLARPEPLEYPKGKLKHRSYGENILKLVEKAKATEDPQKKEVLSKVIANYIKVVHTNWIKENVSDEQVKNELSTLSEGELQLSDGSQLGKFFVQRTNVIGNGQNNNRNQNRHRSNGQNKNRNNGQNRHRNNGQNNNNKNNNNGNAI